LIQVKVRLPGTENISSLCSGADRATKTIDRRSVGFVPVSTTVEEVMKFVKAAFVAALAVTIAGACAPRAEAAPLPTNVAATKAALDTPVVQVRYGGWRGGWGGGYRGWGGYRGGGYRGWGLGAAAVAGGAIASSAYYGGAYPYYGGGYAYGSGYASDYCSPYGYGGDYPGYGARQYYHGW
jgi:hypothetical protein